MSVKLAETFSHVWLMQVFTHNKAHCSETEKHEEEFKALPYPPKSPDLYSSILRASVDILGKSRLCLLTYMP